MNQKTLGTVCVFLAGILWGFMSVFLDRMARVGLQTMDVVALRVWISSAAMLFWLLLQNRTALKIRLKDCWCFVGTGVLSLTMFNFFYFSNIRLTSPGFAAVLLYTSPIFIMLLSAFFFGEKLTWLKAVACGITVVGCVLVSNIAGQSVPLKGILLGLLSGFGYSLYSIFGKFATNKGYRAITITVYTFLFGCIGTIPFANFGKIIEVVGQDRMLIGEILLGVIWTTLAPYLLYTVGLRYIEAGSAGVVAIIEVVVAALVGKFLFAEPFSMLKVLGIVFIIVAILLLNVGGKTFSKSKT